MRTFSDGKQDWSIEISVGPIKRVMRVINVNLSLPHEPDAAGQTLAEKLVFDVISQVDVIWALVTPQAESRSLDCDQWLELIKPAIMKKAADAFFEEWKDFFRNSGQPVQAEVIAQAQAMRDALAGTGLDQLARLNEARTKLLQAQMSGAVDEVLTQLASMKSVTVKAGTSTESSANATDSPVPSGDLVEMTLTGSPGGN